MAYKNGRSHWKSAVLVLSRQIDRRCPYQRLALAVIGLTLSDLAHPDPGVRATARVGVESGYLIWWCDQVGIDHDFLLDLIDDAGLMPRKQQKGVTCAA